MEVAAEPTRAPSAEPASSGATIERSTPPDCAYCDPSAAGCPCGGGRLFYGRGPVQLSWNYNYGALAEAFGRPEICDNPDLVADDPALLWGSAKE